MLCAVRCFLDLLMSDRCLLLVAVRWLIVVVCLLFVVRRLLSVGLVFVVGCCLLGVLLVWCVLVLLVCYCVVPLLCCLLCVV